MAHVSSPIKLETFAIRILLMMNICIIHQAENQLVEKSWFECKNKAAFKHMKIFSNTCSKNKGKRTVSSAAVNCGVFSLSHHTHVTYFNNRMTYMSSLFVFK